MPVIRQYFDLTKPRVVALIVFTALVGMLLAIDGMPTAEEARRGLLGFLGIWLAASSAAAINQLLDARIDAKMARTSWRPIVAGQITPRQALAFALVLGVLSMVVLALFVNTITAVRTLSESSIAARMPATTRGRSSGCTRSCHQETSGTTSSSRYPKRCSIPSFHST